MRIKSSSDSDKASERSVSVIIGVDMKDRLRAVAFYNREKMSDLIKQWIADGLSKYDKRGRMKSPK